MTYSDKYALLKAYKIETGDDPDQNASGSMNKNKYTRTEDKQIRTGNQLESSAEVEKNIET